MIADEIIKYINENFEEENIDRISFISHSWGGIIARAIVNRMRKYRSKFYAFLSLGTPHLGLMSSKAFVKMGIWFYKMFKSSQWLSQLTFDDNDIIEGKKNILYNY